MIKYLLIVILSVLPFISYAQDKEANQANSLAPSQAAGNLVNTDEIFQKLVDKCDDVNLLMLRARIRLELPRIEKTEAETVQKMMIEGFEICSQKKPEEAKVILTKAYEIAKKAASEKFGQTGTGGLDTVKKDVENKKDKDTSNGAKDKPWWKLW